MSNIICKQTLPPNMGSTWFRCSGLPCHSLHLPSTVPSSYLMVIKTKVHCPTHGLLRFADHFALFWFNTAYRKQKGTTIQQMGEEEDCSRRLQPHTCAFYWCQYDGKFHLYWLQHNFLGFSISTGATNQGWDVASLQTRTHKFLLLHGLVQ